MKYQLSVNANKLPKGLFRTPSPYAEVVVDGGPKNGTVIGKTETLVKQTNPDWVSVLFLETDASIYMPLKVTVWDDRGGSNEAVKLGEVKFEATEVAESPGHSQEQNLQNGGTVTISIEESVRGDAQGFMTLQFRGLDIKNIEPGCLNLGRSDPFLEIAKKNLDLSVGRADWNVVHRTKHIPNHLNPLWEEFMIDLEKLCYCDLTHPLRIMIKDYQDNGKHRLIGQFDVTAEVLANQVGVKGNADREKAFKIYEEDHKLDQSRGLICVLKADIVPKE